MPALKAPARAPTALRMAGVQQEDGSLRVKNVPKKEQWVPLLKATDIAPGDIIPVESNGQQLLLVADYDGSVYCVANVCPHLGTPLDQGSLGDGTIVCPLHKSAFSLETGELTGDWCPFPPVLGAWPLPPTPPGPALPCPHGAARRTAINRIERHGSPSTIVRGNAL